MTAGISENFARVVMNYRAISTIDMNGDFGTFGYKNCLEEGDTEAKQMAYLINSSIILNVLYFWIA
jgi:hypothetical protein